MKCGCATFIGQTATGKTLKRYFCKTWRCPRCAPQKAKRLCKEAYLGKPNKFLTLTTNVHKFETPDVAANRLVESFRRMREAIQKKYGYGPIPFIAVFEETANGWPHLHILMRCGYIDQKWISEFMRRRMDSPICWIEQIKSRKKCASYVAKYIGKNPVRFTGCQATWRNKFWLGPRKKKAPSATEWRLSPASLELWAWRYDRHTDPQSSLGVDELSVPTGPPI